MTSEIDLCPTESELVERFKDFYRDLINIDLGHLNDLYADSVAFKDPVIELNSVSELHDYLNHTCTNISHGEFIYLDQNVSENNAYIKWDMNFKHPKLGKDIITVRGISHIKFNEKIVFHEDSYDMGAMLYQHIPILKSAVNFINKRITAQS